MDRILEWGIVVSAIASMAGVVAFVALCILKAIGTISLGWLAISMSFLIPLAILGVFSASWILNLGAFR